jgi:serine/threonine-protein kinase
MSNKIRVQTYPGGNREQGTGNREPNYSIIELDVAKKEKNDIKEYLLALNCYSQGLLAITHSQGSCSLYHLTPDFSTRKTNHLSPLFSLQAPHCVTTLDPQGRWFAFVNASSQEKRSSSTFGILTLPRLKLHQLSLDTNIPTQLVALDSRYGLAIYSSSDDSAQPTTVMRCFNRRGGWMEDLCLPLSLQSVTANPASPYSLFAIEPGEHLLGVLIQLKPLRIKRIAVDILPIFIIAQAWGYLLGDQAGNLRLLDLEGFYLDACQLPLVEDEQITAIAGLERNEILVATWSQQHQGKLYYYRNQSQES